MCEAKLNMASFSALLKSLSVKSLVSGDKEAQVVLRFRPDDELINRLNRLMKADEEVKVTVER